MKSKKLEPFQASGIKIANVKYQYLRAEEDGKLILAKKKGEGAITLQSSLAGMNLFPQHMCLNHL